MNNLKKFYQDKVVAALTEKFGYGNKMAVPTVEKIVLNVGVGKGLKEKDYVENVENTLKRITGQKAVRTKAKKSIASFKIREGMVVGVKVTLRGKRMWDFLEKLIHVTLPRERDFRGISANSFDGKGNYALGFKEYIAFPEIKPDEVEQLHGLEVVVTTSATTDDEGRELLTLLGMPFKK